MTRKTSMRRKVLLSILAVVVVVVGVGAYAWFLTPGPKALVIRAVSEDGGGKVNSRLAAFVKPGVSVISDVAYRPGDSDAKLNVYFPQTATGTLPTIVWTHGGGWVSGSQSQDSNYYRILAHEGFVVISVNYSLAPEKQYPVPVQQLNAALGFIRANAGRYHVNPNALFLAGDSAGAQITAQEATLLTSASYASLMGITPSVPASSIAGTLLNCGPYNLDIARQPGAYAEFIKIVLWSYTGTKNFLNDKKFSPRQSSTTSRKTSHPRSSPRATVTHSNLNPNS
jgi:acetyl esterase